MLIGSLRFPCLDEDALDQTNSFKRLLADFYLGPSDASGEVAAALRYTTPQAW